MASRKVQISMANKNNSANVVSIPPQYVESVVLDGVLVPEDRATNPGVIISNQK